MASKPCLLVADGDPETRRMLGITLPGYGFKVVDADTAGTGLRFTASYKPDAVLLGSELQDAAGIEVLKKIREWSEVPVLLMANNPHTREVVQAFDAGADDFVSKPLNIEILVARINAAIRHSHPESGGDGVLQAGDICVDLVRHEVQVRGNKVSLTPKEYELLSFLMRHQGRMLTHRQILKDVWDDSRLNRRQYLRVYIMQLRKKLEQNPEKPRLILSEVGIGYRFADQPFSGSRTGRQVDAA